MNFDKLINAAQLIILNDKVTENSLGDLLSGNIRAVKGPRRPNDWVGENCFTLHIPSNPRNKDFKTHNGSMLINYYCPSYPSGNANIELMGRVAERLLYLFDDNPPTVTGYEIYDWSVGEVLGPLYDSDAPGEHYSSLRIGFFLREN